MKNQNTFHWSNIENKIVGADISVGDKITTVFLGNSNTTFNDGWTVKEKNGHLGIIWGYKKEFIPFCNFATAVIFTKSLGQVSLRGTLVQ